MAPYVALNFQCYEVLKMHLLPTDRDAPSVARKLVCGALAGSIAQTVTYPLGKGIVTHKQDIQLSSNISF